MTKNIYLSNQTAVTLAEVQRRTGENASELFARLLNQEALRLINEEREEANRDGQS